ncbi:MAG: Eco57I restriction-modification methylase domain-containing protein [Bacteroidia bacterium]
MKNNIHQTITAFQTGDFYDNAFALFKTLGYGSKIKYRSEESDFDSFQAQFVQAKPFDKHKALIEEWQNIHFLFQLTYDDVGTLLTLFENDPTFHTIKTNEYESYLFFALELSGNHYTRSQLAEITRQINGLFLIPAFILFKYKGKLTFSVNHRRLHKKDQSKDVLLKTTLLKDIEIENPHRGHIEIFKDLSLDALKSNFAIHNFADLHNAWQKTFDTQLLNKRFYKELFGWYLWATQHPKLRFPKPENEKLGEDAYKATAVIRLLTRLMFVWFIKEKKLVNEALFEPKNLEKLLKNFQPNDNENANYYQGILQNLFFATLNSPMDNDAENAFEKRQFVEDLKTHFGKSEGYLDKTKYRGKDLFQQPQALVDLLAETPFLNGGLFECLDYLDEESNAEIRYDGFSAKAPKRAVVPNVLFFGESLIDLPSDLADKKTKTLSVAGIIPILNRYKFTIAENTPIEEEIALDPELLGKVFENLLASYNPETQTTARKQTGSFYTPREIVDYMVVESLKSYFKEKLRPIMATVMLGSQQTDMFGNTVKKQQTLELPADDSDKLEAELDQKLTALFAYNQANPFNQATSQKIIEALSDCKILDPACGSGAYPMGALNVMVHILGKLDPNNDKWKAQMLRIAQNDLIKAQALGDKVIQQKAVEAAEERIRYIQTSFGQNKHELDYTRKLFLIENCIYGVDIQQVAVQITKLRFFISLLVEQQTQENAPNLGILSMPNLETKIVAANTLIGLAENQLQANDVIQMEKELDEIRKEIFYCRKWSQKKTLHKTEYEKRKELKKSLIASGFNEATATQKTQWSPFDAIHSSPFFDAPTMFGESVKNGVDIIIGNPPYGFRTVLSAEEKNYFRKVQKVEFSSGDSAELFVKICFDKHLKENGIISFIIPKKSLYGDSWEDTRVNYWKKYNLQFILDTGKSFDNVLLEASVFGLMKNKAKGNISLSLLDSNFTISTIDAVTFDKIFVKSNTCQIYKALYPESIFKAIQDKSYQKSMVEGKLGLAIGTNFFSDEPRAYKLLKGIDVGRYRVRTHRYLDNQENLNWKNAKEFLKPKVISQVIVSHIENPRPHLKIAAAYDEEGILITNTLMSFKLDDCISDKFWLAYLNSQFLSWYAYNFIYARAIRTMHFYNFYIQQLPIPALSLAGQQPFVRLVEYILWLKGQAFAEVQDRYMSAYFEEVLDGMVYELYFGAQMQKQQKSLIAHLGDLPMWEADAPDTEKLATVRAVFHRLHDKTHPVRIALFNLDLIPEIALIMGK